MDVRILGSLRVRADGREVVLGGPRQQLVFAVLLLRAGSPVPTAALIDAVWGDEPPASARKTAQVYVSRLRRELRDDRITGTPAGYVLQVEAEEVDADRFTTLAGRGRRLVATSPESARGILDEALALWRGLPWGELGEQPALRPDVVRLSEERMVVVEDRVEAVLALGQARGLVGELEGLVAGHPLRERLRGQLILALHRSGGTPRALEVYEEGRRLLLEELGVDPSPPLQDLHQRILRADPDLLAVPEAPPAGPVRGARANPYRGLAPFREQDAPLFHGRDQVVAEVLDRLAHGRLVSVVGPSGSGKSSLVRAGVVPALRRGALQSVDWRVATLVPGGTPFAELATALGGTDSAAAGDIVERYRGDDLDVLRAVLAAAPERGRVLLLVDQFEEMFLLGDQQERERFVRGLVEAVDDPHGQLSVLVTVRADFLDRPLAHHGLGDRMADALVTVPPMTAAGVEDACVTPARAAGVVVEPELVAELVAQVTNEAGALPLFQYALTELFDHRSGDLLTRAGLVRLGGMRGILARRADEVFDALDERQRGVARQVFLRLVTLGEGADDTRRRVRRPELWSLPAGRDAVEQVLERFARARLLTMDRDAATGQPTVEVAHEKLLQAWPRLRRWIEDARDGLRRHRTLASAAADWEAAEHHPDFLLAGTRLDRFEHWDTASIALTADEQRFLAASREHRDEVERREDDRRARERELERRGVRRLRLLVGVLAVALIVGGALAAAAVDRGREAAQARDRALVAGELTRARQLAAAAVANRVDDPELSLLLAQHAVQITSLAGQVVPADMVAGLHWTLQAANVTYPVADAPMVVLEGPQGPRGVFDVGVDVLLGMARAEVERDLTTAECAQYFDGGTCPRLDPSALTAVEAEPIAPTPAGATGSLDGTTVRVMSVGYDQTLARPGVDALLDATGITLQYDHENNFEQLLESRVDAGMVDLGILAMPAFVVQLGEEGRLVDLATYLEPARLRRDLSAHLVSLATVGDDGQWPADDGHVWGLPVAAGSKSLVWYPVPEFHDAGYEVPTTWADLEGLVDRLRADGRTPWCHAEENEGASGWPGTDWIEDLLLQAEGPEVYDAWVAGEIAFDDPRVRRAFERFDRLVLAPGHVLGGRAAAASTDVRIVQHPMFDDPPRCWLTHLGNAAPSLFPHGIEAGRDTAVFPMPPITPGGPSRVVGSGAYLVAFTDRPEVRRAVEFLVSPAWAEAFAAEGRWHFAPHRGVDSDAYEAVAARPVARAIRDAVATADSFRFDGSDMMPMEVNEAFWGGMVDFVGSGPDNLDRVLGEIDDAWAAGG